MGKQMEYTLKITTDGPVETQRFLAQFEDVPAVLSVEVTNFRVKPQPREKGGK